MPAGREKQRLSWRQAFFFFFVGLQGLSSTPLALLILLIGSGLIQQEARRGPRSPTAGSGAHGAVPCVQERGL